MKISNQEVVRDFGNYKVVVWYANKKGDMPGDIYNQIDEVIKDHPNDEIMMGFGIVDSTGKAPADMLDWYYNIESAVDSIKKMKEGKSMNMQEYCECNAWVRKLTSVQLYSFIKAGDHVPECKEEWYRREQCNYPYVKDRGGAQYIPEWIDTKKIKSKNEIREDVTKDVTIRFRNIFTEYSVPEELINAAVDDVLECSAIEGEGYYSDGDVSLGCQRAILSAMGKEI